MGRDLELVAYAFPIEKHYKCYVQRDVNPRSKKKYKEITKELHGLERPWAPAGLPDGWRDSGRAPRQPVDPLTSTARPRTRRPVSRRWIGSGEAAGRLKSGGGEGGENLILSGQPDLDYFTLFA